MTKEQIEKIARERAEEWHRFTEQNPQADAIFSVAETVRYGINLALRGLDSREAVLEKAALAIRPVIEERGDEQHAWNCALTWAMTTIRALKSKPASPEEP